MKEIKFRAWQENDGAIGSRMNYDVLKDNTLSQMEKWDWKVMQFTGLKDKKRTAEYPEGQEIYEGDILELRRIGGRTGGIHTIFQVTWNEALAMFMDKKKDGDPLYLISESVKIIGNIYENAELLAPSSPPQVG